MKIRGTIRGRTIFLDTLPGLAANQRVDIDITPVEDTSEITESRSDKVDTREPDQKRKRGTRLSDLDISPEELDTRIATEPQFEFIRQADEHRRKMDKRRGGKSNLTTQWIREDRDR